MVPCRLWLVACRNGSGRNGACCNGACCTGACCNGDCWLQPAVCTCDAIEAKAVGKKFPLGYPGVPLSTLVLKYPGVPWSTLKECATRARRSGRVCARSTFVLADGGGSPRQLCAKDSAGDAAAVHRRLLLGTPTAPTSPRARALAHAHRKRSRRCMRTHARTHAQAHAHQSLIGRCQCRSWWGVAFVHATHAACSMLHATRCFRACASARRSPTSRCATSRR